MGVLAKFAGACIMLSYLTTRVAGERGGRRVSLTIWEENLVVVAIFDRVLRTLLRRLKLTGFMAWRVAGRAFGRIPAASRARSEDYDFIDCQ